MFILIILFYRPKLLIYEGSVQTYPTWAKLCQKVVLGNYFQFQVLLIGTTATTILKQCKRILNPKHLVRKNGQKLQRDSYFETRAGKVRLRFPLGILCVADPSMLNSKGIRIFKFSRVPLFPGISCLIIWILKAQ